MQALAHAELPEDSAGHRARHGFVGPSRSQSCTGRGHLIRLFDFENMKHCLQEIIILSHHGDPNFADLETVGFIFFGSCLFSALPERTETHRDPNCGGIVFAAAACYMPNLFRGHLFSRNQRLPPSSQVCVCVCVEAWGTGASTGGG